MASLIRLWGYPLHDESACDLAPTEGFPDHPTMLPTPRFSVVILSYNRPDLVRTAIDSVLAQEESDYELIVVDDASRQETIDSLREYEGKAQIIYRKENGGEMAARNTGLEAARGEYLAYLDSDDAWFPWTLKAFSAAIDRHGAPSMVGANVAEFTKEEELERFQSEPCHSENHPSYFEADHYIGIGAVVLKLSEAKRIGGFVPKRLNALDSDFLFRMGDSPGFVAILAPVTLALRTSEGILFNTNLTFGGMLHLLQSERDNLYPGNSALRLSRLKHLTRRTRNAAIMCLNAGEQARAWRLFFSTLAWNIQLGNLKFLLGFPIASLLRLFGKRV